MDLQSSFDKTIKVIETVKTYKDRVGDSIDSAKREIRLRTKKEPRFDSRGHAISDNASIMQSNLSRAQYGKCSCRCGELR